jgi:hypothetical protein
MRGLSDSNLQNMWRKAVRIKHCYRCFFCQLTVGEKEAHHIVKRNNLLLRHDWRNGVLLCRWGDEDSMSCHAFAETPEGKRKINTYLEKNNWLDYLQERSGQSKQWFVKRGISRNDFLLEKYTELKEVINAGKD